MSHWPLTSRGLGLLMGAAGCWLMGRLFGVGELAMAAFAAAALLLLGILFTRVLSARLGAARRVDPAHLQMDEAADVAVTVTNHGRFRTAALFLDDQAPESLGASARFTVQPLATNESVQVRYRLRASRRGLYRVGPLAADMRDPFGVARRPVTVGDSDEVVVYPRILPLTGGPPLAGHLGSGSDGVPRAGPSGDDLAMIREYVQGDDLRRVHWRSTAHRGRLMVRQEENRQRPEAVVMIDTDPARHTIGLVESTFETMVTAAASVLALLDEREYRTRLVDSPLSGPPPPITWAETMTRLAMAAPSPLDTSRLWQQLERGLAGESSLVTVLPPPGPEALRWMVRAGRTFGSRVAILVANGDSDPASTVAALKKADWHATMVSNEQEVPVAWARLALRRSARR